MAKGEWLQLINELTGSEVMTTWINPNDKTQKQYLPWIGEKVLFCHGGKVYYGDTRAAASSL